MSKNNYARVDINDLLSLIGEMENTGIMASKVDDTDTFKNCFAAASIIRSMIEKVDNNEPEYEEDYDSGCPVDDLRKIAESLDNVNDDLVMCDFDNPADMASAINEAINVLPLAVSLIRNIADLEERYHS